MSLLTSKVHHCTKFLSPRIFCSPSYSCRIDRRYLNIPKSSSISNQFQFQFSTSSSSSAAAAGGGDDDSSNNSDSSRSYHAKFMNPIVGQLWEQRQLSKAKQQMMHNKEKGLEGGLEGGGELGQEESESQQRQNQRQIKFKHPSASKTTIDYPFSDDEFLREAYCSPGGTMRFGKILEDLDALAGNIAFHHVVVDHVGEVPMLVTAAVDRIALRNIPRLKRDQRLSGQVTWVGNSSMEIRMQIHEVNNHEVKVVSDADINTSELKSEPEHYWLEAFFTFVAVDPETKRPTKICPLLPQTSEERALFELGALKASKKKENRKKGIYQYTTVGKQITEDDMRMEQRAENLLEEAFPLLHMPSLADSGAILMSHTVLQNTLIAQPQVRNLANRIFGGFLMRRAFELAFSNAYCFGGCWPQMLEVDNITFHTPVDVGDLLQFTSRVIYSLPSGGNLGTDVAMHSDKPLAMIEVECFVMEPSTAKAHLSNRFYFTFLLPDKDSCKKVLPGSLGEARRMVSRMVADEEQAGLAKGYLHSPKV